MKECGSMRFIGKLACPFLYSDEISAQASRESLRRGVGAPLKRDISTNILGAA
jgi:hypothetical protein